MCTSANLQVPQNNRDIVRVAITPLNVLLGADSPYIMRLVYDHANISQICSNALDFKAQKKSWIEFGWSLGKTIGITTTITTCLALLIAALDVKPKHSLFSHTALKVGLAFGVVLGTIIASLNYSDEKPDSQIRRAAELERSWMTDKLTEIGKKYTELSTAVAECKDENFRSPENQNRIKDRDLLNLLQGYFRDVSQTRYR